MPWGGPRNCEFPSTEPYGKVFATPMKLSVVKEAKKRGMMSAKMIQGYAALGELVPEFVI
jgi:hypothetical protein